MRNHHYRIIHRFDPSTTLGRGEEVFCFRAQIFQQQVTVEGFVLTVIVREQDDPRSNDMFYEVTEVTSTDKGGAVTMKFICPTRPTVLFEKLTPSMNWQMVVGNDETPILLWSVSHKELDVLYSEFSAAYTT